MKTLRSWIVQLLFLWCIHKPVLFRCEFVLYSCCFVVFYSQLKQPASEGCYGGQRPVYHELKANWPSNSSPFALHVSFHIPKLVAGMDLLSRFWYQMWGGFAMIGFVCRFVMNSLLVGFLWPFCMSLPRAADVAGLFWDPDEILYVGHYHQYIDWVNRANRCFSSSMVKFRNQLKLDLLTDI